MTALKLVATGEPRAEGRPLPLKLSQIVPDPEQPRQTYVDKDTEALADSIQQEGQETPVHVFTHPDPSKRGLFMLSAGERRIRAFQIIAKRTGTDPIVEAYIKVISDRRMQFRRAFIENLHRKDLVALDEAAAYARLRQDGDTLEAIAKLVDRSTSHVKSYLKLNDLCPGVKALMDPNLDPSKQLSVTSAIDIAKSMSSPTLQLEVAMEIINRQLGVADARLLLGTRAENVDYKAGQEFRKPSDDYKKFKSFLGRTYTSAQRMSEQNLGRMYAYRDDEKNDRAADRAEISNIKVLLDRMLTQLNEEV
jgi:ParB family chromosome partitioning protein